MSLVRRRRVAITTEESSVGVPLWGARQIITDIPDGETDVAFENLIAGRRYYVRTWTEDAFGQKSGEVNRVVYTPPDNTVPAVPEDLALTAGTLGFRATWSAVADIDVAEYELRYADDDGSGTGPDATAFTELKTRTTQMWVDQVVGQKTWAQVRSIDFSGNTSQYSALVAVTPIRITPLTFGAQGFLDSGSPLYCYVKVPTAVQSVTDVQVSFAFRQFMAPATAATSGGADTSGASSATTSGASNTSSSNEKTLTLGLSSNLMIGTSGAASAGTAHTHGAGSYEDAAWPFITDIDPHSHTIAHTHNIPHTHSTPNHTHALTYGTYEETMPVSQSVKVTVYERVAGVWTLRHTSASQTALLVDLDLTSVIDSAGDWRIQVKSDAAQPNGGRLGCDIFGAITAVV